MLFTALTVLFTPIAFVAVSLSTHSLNLQWESLKDLPTRLYSVLSIRILSGFSYLGLQSCVSAFQSASGRSRQSRDWDTK